MTDRIEIKEPKNDAVETSSSILSIALAWTSMTMAIISGASVGPVFKYMENQHIEPCLAASWRCQCMVFFLLPLALIERCRQKTPVDWFVVKPELQYQVWVHVMIAGLGWCANLLLWIIALKYTTIVRASIIANTHPLMLVIYLQTFGGQKVSSYEWIGVFVSLCGIIMATMGGLVDPSEVVVTTTDDELRHLFGDFLCLLASIGEVVIILNRVKTKLYVPLMQYTTATTLLVAVVASIVTVAFEGGSDGVGIFCFEDNCLLGWATPRWADKMLLFGLIVGVICITGFNYAIQYISPLVFSSITLVDPAVTGLISWTAGIEGIPDLPTMLGGVVVIGGVGLITMGEHSRSEQEKKEHASPRTPGTDVSETDSEMSESDSKDIEMANLTVDVDEDGDSPHHLSAVPSSNQSSWWSWITGKRWLASNEVSAGCSNSGNYSPVQSTEL